MRVLPSCSSCNSFVGARATECPSCGEAMTRLPAAMSAALTLATGSAIAITLMGCYGAAPMQMKEPQPATTATTTTPQADAAPPGELGLAK
jgi:hypothetical protein